MTRRYLRLILALGIASVLGFAAQDQDEGSELVHYIRTLSSLVAE